MRQEEKRHYNAMIHNLRILRGRTRMLPAEEQESFGRDADLLLDVIYAAVTRTGTDTRIMMRFLDYIMSFPDRVGLDGIRHGGEAFEAVKKAQAEGRIDKYMKQ